MSANRTRSVWAALAALVLAAGCGDDGPKLVQVSGTVTVDGEPLARKTVRFYPEPGTPGQGAGASTGEDGKFTLIAVRPGATRDVSGVPPGTYRVVVTEPMFPIEAPLPEAPADGSPAPAIGPPTPTRKKPAGPGIPAAYTKPETTPLKVQVPEGGGVLDLPLSSKP
jgi:hypothetical protein